MSIKSICGPCWNGDHERCHDGIVEGLIGGWYCECAHTAEEDAERRDRVLASLGLLEGEDDDRGT